MQTVLHNGYIRFPRVEMTDPIFQDAELWKLWCLCRFQAGYRERQVMVAGQKEPVVIGPGQFVTSRDDLHALYYPHKSRANKTSMSVWRWLERLQDSGFLSIKTCNKYTIVTICDADIYEDEDSQNVQQNVQDMFSSCSAHVQQTPKNRGGNVIIKEKKEKKEKKNTPPIVPPTGGDTPALFERFWQAYPRRIAKPVARKAWDKLTATPELTAAITAAIAAQVEAGTLDLREKGRFCPHPATWLNQRRWEDDLSVPEPPEPKRGEMPTPHDPERVNRMSIQLAANRQYLMEKNRRLNDRFREKVIVPLREEMSDAAWAAFIEPLLVIRADNGTVVLYHEQAQWVSDTYKPRIEAALEKPIVVTDTIPEPPP